MQLRGEEEDLAVATTTLIENPLFTSLVLLQTTDMVERSNQSIENEFKKRAHIHTVNVK